MQWLSPVNEPTVVVQKDEEDDEEERKGWMSDEEEEQFAVSHQIVSREVCADVQLQT